MKAKLEQLTEKNQHQSFLCYEVNIPVFEFHWHYHPEYELIYIVSGRGKRLVGDSYENFQEGDMVLLGSNLSHTWVSELCEQDKCIAIVIQFTQNFIEPLLHYPEFSGFENILYKSNRGLKIIDKHPAELTVLLQQLCNKSGLDAFIDLLQIFKRILYTKAEPISSIVIKPLKIVVDSNRINEVFIYIQNYFKQKIPLQKAASLIHLSESAFCKYFKRVSGKTFSDYVNDVRLSYACQLLIETDKPIARIAYESGFGSISYFNRVFRKKKSITPNTLRKKIGFIQL